MTWAGRCLAWAACAAAAFAIVSGVVAPRLGNATPYTVLTGSMRPGLPPGTLVVVRPASSSEIGLGDVITYQVRSGEATVVTHRVVAVGLDGSGGPVYRTQGDANPVADQDWVRPVQVRGKLWYSVPYLGRASTFLSNQQRDLGSRALGGLLAGYAVLTVLQAARRRGRDQQGQREKDHAAA